MSPRREDLDDLDALLARVQHVLLDLRVDAVMGSELSLQQLKVLMLAEHRSPITAHAVADRLGVSAATVSGLVSRLVEGGLLVQEPDPHDRRSRLLSATDRGRAALEEVATLRTREWRALLSRMSDPEIDALRTWMTALERVGHELVGEQADESPAT